MKNKYITTQCGLEKYDQLKVKSGIFNSVRLYWFVFFASLRDGYGSIKLWFQNAKNEQFSHSDININFTGNYLMKITFLTFLSVTSVFLFIDVIWLSQSFDYFYEPNIGDLLREDVIILPAALFYLIYPLGITILIVLPSLK